MHELDSVTQQNSSIAQKSTLTANELLQQSKNIDNIADDLIEVITGNNNSKNTSIIFNNIENQIRANQITNKIDTSNFNRDKSREMKSSQMTPNSKIELNENKYKSEENNNRIVPTPSADDPRFEDL